jgi:hypothetical protein
MLQIIAHLKNCLIEIQNYLLFIMVELMIFGYFLDKQPAWFNYLVLGTIPIACYFIRCFIHRFWLFALLHLVPLVLVFGTFADLLVERIVFTFAVVVQIIISLAVRIAVYTQPERASYGGTATLPIIAVAMGAFFFLLKGPESLIVLTISFIALHFLERYLGQFLYYIDINRRTTGNMPLKEIFILDFPIVGGFTLITVLLMLSVAVRESLGRFVSWLLLLLRDLLRWLISLIPSGAATEEEMLAEEPLPDMLSGLPETPGDVAGSNLLLQALEIAMAILLVAVVVILVVGAVLAAVALVKAVFKLRLRGKNIAEDDVNRDLIEILKRPKRVAKPKRKHLLFRSADEKIRALFAATMLKQAQNNMRYFPLQTATPCELLALFEEEREAASVLVGLYEKARYAKESCTNADFRLAKKIKGLLKST